ncbi:DUF4136 domain-containing protein [Rhodonellum sp.]|uniref:DUF4136 domain-containing protein n=1 Tax=Rhodonellum sp. TaxID=2231180 RepID=UPI00271DB42F|nr:DUF4136 domain-containing protein [Rhodonellum sp.]MDO9554435.1 DUF4136 domain-containing protein [Rhodonellum sp.]
MKNWVLLIAICIQFSCATAAKITVLPTDKLGFDLDAYQTFGFYGLDVKGDTSNQFQRNVHLLKTAIIQQMENRGLRESPDPELKINIGIRVEEKIQTRQTGLMTDPGTFNYIGQRRYTWKTEIVEVGRYKKGSIRLDFVDAKQNQVVWMGISEKIIPNKEKKIPSEILKIVDAFFTKINGTSK